MFYACMSALFGEPKPFLRLSYAKEMNRWRRLRLRLLTSPKTELETSLFTLKRDCDSSARSRRQGCLACIMGVVLAMGFFLRGIHFRTSLRCAFVYKKGGSHDKKAKEPDHDVIEKLSSRKRRAKWITQTKRNPTEM